jgi:CHAT domain-containing protein/Tfp pilus assembly protein PilF
MRPFLALALGIVGATQAQQSSAGAAAESTGSLSNSISAVWIAAHPDQARDSLRTWLAATARADQAVTATLLAKADQLGADYLLVWGDSFPLLDARRFASWSPDNRIRRVRADSLRRAGNAALGRAGVSAALHDWRASLQVARGLGDTAAIAAALGNIGAGFYRAVQLDSARRYFALAHRLAGIARDRRTMMNALGGLASVSKDQGDLHAAATQYTEALAIRRSVGDYRGFAADANNLGVVAAALGDRAEARRRYTEALTTAREHALDEPAAAALVNLGVLASRMGDDLTAEKAYAEALALYRKLDDPADEALVLHDLGLLEADRGNYPAAVSRYRAALTILQTTGPAEYTVAARLDLAAVFAAMGSLDRAERQLGAAELLARRGGLSPATEGRLRLTRGDLALEFNRLEPARDAYQAALALLRKAGDPAGEADALAALGTVSLIEEDNGAARDLLISAAARQQSLSDRRGAGLTRLLAAQAMRQSGDTASARRTILAAIDSLRASDDPVAEAWAQCQAGDLQRALGLPLAAEADYRGGLTRLGRRPASGVAVCLYEGLGGALRARRAWRDAITELQHGISAIEAVAGSVVVPGPRADFLTDKWQLYTDLALAQRAAGDDSSAFETSERLRARQTLDLLARGPGVGASLGAGEEDPRALALRRRITALIDLAETQGARVALRGDEALEHLPNESREALAQAQDAYAELLDSLERERAGSRPAPTSGPPGWRAVAAHLPDDEAVIEYLVTDSAAIAFVVTSDRLVTVELPVTGSELRTEVDFVRGTLAPSRATGSTSAWRTPLNRLRGQLVTPIEATGLLQGKRRLLIVPHRELHYLPFAALVETGAGGRFLIQQYEIGYVSSAAVWLTLLARAPSPDAGRVLALAPATRDLPGASAEVAAIAKLYGPDATALTGERATRRALADEVPGRSIIHLATLGVLNKHNPLFSFVKLAPSKDSDGRLEVHDVSALDLRADLVVLSACQTAVGSGRVSDVPPGDDWVGLVQAFQAAGAARVMATLWPVDDSATAKLMTQFYGELRAGRTEAQALATAQRKAIGNPASRAPFYWAGFVLDGSL